MPTAGRLVGALTFMAMAYVVTQIMIPLFPDSGAPRLFLEINLLAAVIAGWITLGSRAGTGVVNAFANALTALAVFAFWMFFLHACGEMLEEAFRKQYDGPVEAIVGVFELMIDLGKRLLVPETLAILFGGAFLGSFITEYFARNYR